MAMTMRVQRQAGLARAQPAKVRVTRRRCVVVNAEKKSVGDLTEADLKGKAVFVRAGEHPCSCNSSQQLHRLASYGARRSVAHAQRLWGAARPAWGLGLLRLVLAGGAQRNCWLHSC